MFDEMDVWYLYLVLWSQIVLAKNLSRGEIVGYLCIGFIIAKKIYSCMMLDIMFQHLGTVQCAMLMCLGLRVLYLIKESTPYFLLAK